jgi:hypothetical protein
MKRTVTGSSKMRPNLEDNDFALILHCVTCGTLRAFVLNIHLAALQARRISSFAIESTCSVCGHIVGASIAWTNVKQRGYIHRTPPPMEGLKLEDGCGLEKPTRRIEE